MITAGGENIAPVPIEEAIKAELSEIVSNVMLVGDHRRHLSVILTLKPELDPVTSQPLDTLHPQVRHWLQSRGCDAETPEQMSNNLSEEAEEDIMKGIEAANTRAVSRAHRVHKYLIAPSEFSVESGELTPTLKMKRHFILNKYRTHIDKLYS